MVYCELSKCGLFSRTALIMILPKFNKLIIVSTKKRTHSYEEEKPEYMSSAAMKLGTIIPEIELLINGLFLIF
jgi:hypothetical protein